MKIVIDIPDNETFIGWYTRNDGVNQYHNAKTLGEPNYITFEQIRAEIEQTADEEQKHDEKWAKGLRYAVKIIGKYAEQEEKSCSNCKYWFLDKNNKNRKCKYCFEMDEYVAESKECKNETNN